MATGLTQVQVYNLAIDIIKDSALVTVDDATSTARWLNRNFDHTVRTILRSYPWNFAKEYHELSANAMKPLHTWGYAYDLPSGTLRVLPITQYGDRFGAQVPFEIVGNQIFTDAGAPLRLRLIMDKTDNPGVWDDLFTEMVRCNLALGMANKFTSKSKYIELASQLYNAAKEQAEMIDAFEGSPEPVENFDIIRARGADQYDYTVRRYSH